MYIPSRSRTCESGSTESTTSADENERWPELSTTFETRFECVSITPFGSPVVPDV